MNVSCQFIGRLGNNMFQTAACIGYAKKYGVQWGVPAVSKEVPNFHNFFPGLPIYEGHEFKRYNAADPSQFNYWPIPEHKQGVKLVGFFQSEKFFEGAHDEIRKAFRLDIKPVDAVSIHVRRGDYVQHSNSFPPVTMDYIYAAMDHMVALGHRKFIVVSDGIEWCKENIKTSLKYEISFFEGNEFEDLSLMASCEHHIISNSTFSWWAAWLGHNPDKIIVSPSADNWFGPGFTGGVPKDLIPSSWHQIKFR